jgi:hypothetical protein
MTTLSNLEATLENAKLQIKLYKAAAFIVECFDKNYTRQTPIGTTELLFNDNKLFRCGYLNLTIQQINHFQYMTDKQKNSDLNKLKRAIKLIDNNRGAENYIKDIKDNN